MVNLTKGQKTNVINLNKDKELTKALIGLGWDARSTDGQEFDLDASAIICGADGKVLNQENFIFYNNPKDPSGAVEHTGDNRNGEGDGDDEAVIVDLAKLPAEVDKIVFIASIYEAEARNQSFGQVKNAYIRLVDFDKQDGEEIHFDLGEDYSTERSVEFAELYRKNGEWKYGAIGQGYSSGLEGIIEQYGLFADK